MLALIAGRQGDSSKAQIWENRVLLIAKEDKLEPYRGIVLIVLIFYSHNEMPEAGALYEENIYIDQCFGGFRAWHHHDREPESSSQDQRKTGVP